MKQQIYGLAFDYEGGASTSLAIQPNASDKHQPIAYQLRMLREQRIPRMLPISSEEVNGELVLRYEITAKRRFVQLLHVQPPDIQLALETAYQLVHALRECSAYMLDENQVALHEDLVFSSGSLRDFQLCYLPFEGLNKKSVTEELRCLLLRLFSAVEGGFEGKIAMLLGVLSDENYSLKQLEEQLQRVWLKGDIDSSETLIASPTTERRSGEWLTRVKRWLQQRIPSTNAVKAGAALKSEERTSQPIAIEAANDKPSGRTELLSNHEPAISNEIILCLSRDGEETKVAMTEDRWIIGRSGTGIHHTDLSEGVSRIHVEVSKHRDGLEVKDLGSLNGSYLNGERMIPYKAYPFTHTDVLKYARTALRVTSTP